MVRTASTGIRFLVAAGVALTLVGAVILAVASVSPVTNFALLWGMPISIASRSQSTS